jgi:ACS family glucarate transporter-like MFS transporter
MAPTSPYAASVPDVSAERPTRVRYGVIGFALAVAVITYVDRICISLAAPFMRVELGLSTTQMGWAFTAFFWTYALFEVPGGWLGDRIGARKALTRVVLLWSLFTAATGWVTGLTSLLIVRALFGAGEAGCFPNVTRAFAGWLPAQERAKAQGILWLAARWGGAFTPLLVALMLQHMSWRRCFEIFGVVGVIWAFFFFRFFRDRPEDHPRVNEAERALMVGREKGFVHEPVPWKKFLRSRTVWMLWAQYMAINYGWPFYITWLPTYLQEARGLNLKQSAIYAGLPLFFGGLGCLLAGALAKPLMRHYKGAPMARKLLPMIGCTSAAICLAISPTIGNPLVAMLIVGFASFSNDLLMPSAWATCMDVGGRYAGTLSGSMNMMGNLMAGASQFLVTAILVWTNRNWSVSFYVAAGFYLLGTLAWAFVDPRERLGTAAD